VRETRIAVGIPERRGSFRELMACLGHRVVTAFDYHYAAGGVAQVFVGIRIRDALDASDLMSTLKSAGYATIDLTGNELWKTHSHHIVAADRLVAEDVQLFQFQFPERQGALAQFLGALGNEWDIHLFHYRNQGFDHGRVLCGIQCTAARSSKLRDVLVGTGFEFVPTSDALSCLEGIGLPSGAHG
ncbi:MAG: threonine ammonia-lyase, biosynthetic, partial [Alphaproteobacteria bacterium]|nr:threonine ammonia-lyase, biosynthetic [Alphaproteobacteria bacterium]